MKLVPGYESYLIGEDGGMILSGKTYRLQGSKRG